MRPQDQPEYCPHCGTAVGANASFCRECGSDAGTGWSDADDIEIQAGAAVIPSSLLDDSEREDAQREDAEREDVAGAEATRSRSGGATRRGTTGRRWWRSRLFLGVVGAAAATGLLYQMLGEVAFKVAALVAAVILGLGVSFGADVRSGHP